MTSPVAKWTGLTITGQRTVDEGGVYFLQTRIVETKLRHDPGAELFNEDIKVGNQLVDDPHRPAVLQIHGHTAFAPSEVSERGGHLRAGNIGRDIGDHIGP